MFSNKEKGTDRIETLIGEQCHITGSLNSTSLIKIDGSVDGDIICEDDIVLGESAHINGNTVCNNAYINGLLNGNICCKSTLTIEICGKVTGDISVKKLVISEGGILDGKCTMINYDNQDIESNNLII